MPLPVKSQVTANPVNALGEGIITPDEFTLPQSTPEDLFTIPGPCEITRLFIVVSDDIQVTPNLLQLTLNSTDFGAITLNTPTNISGDVAGTIYTLGNTFNAQLNKDQGVIAPGGLGPSWLADEGTLQWSCTGSATGAAYVVVWFRALLTESTMRVVPQ